MRVKEAPDMPFDPPRTNPIYASEARAREKKKQEKSEMGHHEKDEENPPRWATPPTRSPQRHVGRGW